MRMAKLIFKKFIISIAVLVFLIVFYAFVWPATSKAVATSHLQHVSSQELQPLIQPVSGLMQGARLKSTLECDEVSHTHTKTQLYCQNVNSYKYNQEPLADSARAKIVDEAAVLDKVLAQNGWTIDRPQDPAKTVVASIPSTPLEPFHLAGVPFHKNIGNISCNFEVEFSGPTDGISPGAININQFSCQQNVTYFMLHFTNYTNPGFGG